MLTYFHFKLIVPLFPQGRAIEARNRRGGKHGKFSLTAARIAGQRAYLATYPFYVPFMLNLWDIARWINWPKSGRLCAVSEILRAQMVQLLIRPTDLLASMVE